MSFALYVHVPLCVSRCAYCDFATTTGESTGSITDALVTSLTALRGGIPGASPDTIYFGGGTPTALGDALPPVVRQARAWTDSAPAEFTVETNPDTTDATLIVTLRESGVDRFSLGVQSFDDDILTLLGRRHRAERVEEAISTIVDSGARISIDLIAGVPGQSAESWERDLRRALGRGIDHVSVYPLTLSETAPLFGRIVLDEDVAADRLEAAARVLSEGGLERYEIASFARRGERARHNLAYWSGIEYLGVGPGASSMLSASCARELFTHMGWSLEFSPDVHRVRFTMTDDVTAWLRDPLAAPMETETLTLPESLREDLLLALRVTDGAPGDLVERAMACNPGLHAALDDLEALGLVERVPLASDPGNDVTQRLTLSERGWLLGNEVFGRIWNAG